VEVAVIVAAEADIETVTVAVAVVDIAIVKAVAADTVTVKAVAVVTAVAEVVATMAASATAASNSTIFERVPHKGPALPFFVPASLRDTSKTKRTPILLQNPIFP
jgi:hypothetical protein